MDSTPDDSALQPTSLDRWSRNRPQRSLLRRSAQAPLSHCRRRAHGIFLPTARCNSYFGLTVGTARNATIVSLGGRLAALILYDRPMFPSYTRPFPSGDTTQDGPRRMDSEVPAHVRHSGCANAATGRAGELVPSLLEPFRLLPTVQWSPGTGLTLRSSWEPSPLAASQRCPRRPCHPRAISSGHQRYPPDSHGQSDRTYKLADRS